MILTRYHTTQSMSVQRIARDCKVDEKTARYYLLLNGTEKAAIEWGKRQPAKH